MRFSVVIPTYNRKEKLKETLKSVLDQSFKDFEVIVVDDGSSDDTREIVRESGKTQGQVSYFHQPNTGPAKARNLGTKQAKGQLIAFTDDDCVLPHDWLERLLEGFQKHSEVVGVGGYLQASEETLKKSIFARYERYVSLRSYETRDKEVVSGFDCPAGGTNNMAYTKKVIEEVGGFDEAFPVAAGEDADIKLRITKLGYKLLYLPLKVEHHQDYHLKGFLKQSFNRGIGSFYFQKKWSQAPSKIMIYGHLLGLIPKLLFNLLTKKQRIYSLLDFLFAWQECRGRLKHA